MWDTVSQIGIAILGFSAILLIACKNRWGTVCGLLSQPFWFYTTYHHEQWGLFLLSFAYAVVWLHGIWVWFFKDKKSRSRVADLPPEYQEIYHHLYQHILDYKEARVILAGVSVNDTCQLIKALERAYQSFGAQELRCSTVDLTLKPYDEPTW